MIPGYALDDRQHGESGFTLIETAVAMLLVMLCLMLCLTMLVEQPRIEQRLRAQQRVTLELEGWLERIRANPETVVPGTKVLSEDPTHIEMTVEKGRIVDLLDVSLVATFEVQGQERTRVLTTSVWRFNSGFW